MKDKYVDLINQTFDFPVDEFSLNDDKELTFHDIPLMDLVEQYGTVFSIYRGRDRNGQGGAILIVRKASS